MTCKQFNTEINGNYYSYTQLPASRSLKLKFKLAKIIGVALTELIPVMKSKSEKKQIEAFGRSIELIFSTNDPDHVANLIASIFSPAFIGKGEDAQRLDIDKHFTGNLKEMYEVLFWILKCEYEDFINGFM